MEIEDGKANAKVIQKVFQVENALKNKHLYKKQSIFKDLINDYRNNGYAINDLDEAKDLFEKHPLLMEDYEFDMEIELNPGKPIYRKADKYLDRMYKQTFKSLQNRKNENKS